METQKSASRYVLTALAVILVITAFILVGLNAFDLESRLGLSLGGRQSQQQAEEQYRLGYLAARSAYREVCPMAEKHGIQISGTVTAIAGDKLTLDQDYFDTDPKIDGVTDVRTAKLVATTKIQAQTNKPSEQLNKEMAAFKPGPDATPPAPYTLSALKLSDLKIGDRVLITSGQDLRLSEEFDALTINVLR